MGVTGPRAFSEQVQRSQPGEVDVSAYVVGVSSSELIAARRDARRVVEQVLAPLHPTTVSTATSALRQIGDSGRLGYLGTRDARAGRVELTSGRYPRPGPTRPIEALAPDAAVRALHLRLGDQLALGPGPGLGESDLRATVVIVGTFRGLPGAAAESDPLTGAGFDPAYQTGGATAPTSGPFLVGDAAFRATGFEVTGLRVDGDPDLAAADQASLDSTERSLSAASTVLAERVGPSADVTRVASELPDTLDRLHAQQRADRSAVLVAVLLVAVLGLAALVLAGRILAQVREDEHELLATLGRSRGQHLAAALTEALLLAVAAAVVAVPAAALAFAAMTQLPSLRAARLAESPTVTPALVVTAVAGAALLTLVLVVSPMVGWESARLAGRRQALARTGADLLLLVVVVTAGWQLYSEPAAGADSDTLLVLAPMLCLGAATLLAVRSLPSAFALVAAVGARSRSLLPVSLTPSTLRLGAGTALVLLSLAAAAATFGVALHSTWQRSQSDQADLRVGTDLALALNAPPTAHDVAAVARTVTRGESGDVRSVLSPVTARPVALGQYFGVPGTPPELVALDTRLAGALLRGDPGSGATWSEVGDRLAPPTPVHGISLRARRVGISMVGHAPTGVVVSVTPSVVLQDAAGFRSTLDADSLPVDGRPHALRWSAPPPPGQSIVALHLTFTDEGTRPPSAASDDVVSVALRVPGRAHDAGPAWQTHTLGDSGVVLSPSVAVRHAGAIDVVTVHTALHLPYLLSVDGELLATAFEASPAVPVAVSQALADATGARIGGELSATLSDTVVPLHVVDIVPTVPSAPGQIAVLADGDSVSRALIDAGHVEPVVDAFWASTPSSATANRLSELRLGRVTTRDEVADELTRGPMQIMLPIAYATLTGSAIVVLLAGAVLVVSADQRRRTAEVARLRALGLPRSGARLLVFAQHGALLAALVLTGVLIGAVTAVALDRRLVGSDRGTAPVPPAVLAWPWSTELLLAAGLVAACLVIAAVAAASQVRSSDTSQLRTGD